MKTFLTFVFSVLLYPLSYAVVTPTLNDVWVIMSDGDSLEADVYIPLGVDSAEVILVQTPYNKNQFSLTLPFQINTNTLLNNQQFIWVIVDWRGFYGSNMADVSNVDRGQDAYDVCDWIVSQTWHKDRIGTWGPSALGGIQYQLIEKDHPNHTCAVPQVATGHQSYDAYFYGGVLEKARLDQLDALGYGLSPIILAQVYDSFVWDAAAASSWYADDIKIPTLAQGGWYDHNIDKMMTFYKDARNLADLSVQNEQWLLVGPWVHGGTGAAYMGSSIQGELTYPNAEFKTDSMALNFFEFYLLDSVNGWDATPMVTYYDIGNDVWQSSNSDDISFLTTDILYLNQNNQLISGMGVDSSSIISDPQNPSPTIGGATLSNNLNQGPYDQSSLDARTDLVTFTTGILSTNVSVTGRIQLDLYVSADQADCDISVRLVDKYPDGRNMLITDGIKRMRFRNNSYTQTDEVFMTNGVVYNVQVDLPFTNYTWIAGHELKIYIGGNHAIRFDVNEQDGGAMYQTVTGNTANISIHHNATYPSQIKLPGNNPSLNIADGARINFSLFPNPANNQLSIESDFLIQSYQIVDLSGKLIVHETYTNGSIDISNLEPALYILKVQTFEGLWSEQKFTKL
jgi:uncharacterized protein